MFCVNNSTFRLALKPKFRLINFTSKTQNPETKISTVPTPYPLKNVQLKILVWPKKYRMSDMFSIVVLKFLVQRSAKFD